MKDVRTPKVQIQSLARADAILSAIAKAPSARVRLVDVAKELGLHKNTVFSILNTLCALGYAKRVMNSHEYALGSRVIELARASESNLDILRQFKPLMLRLVGAVNESVSLAIPAGRDVLIVNTIESSHGVRGARYLGRHSPYHASAVGKAILASISLPERDAVLESADLPKLTPKTINTRTALLHHLEEVGKRGFAMSMEEEEIGANAVAVPLISPMGEVLGAVAIWGPAPRLTQDTLFRLGTGLVKACHEVSDATTTT